MTHMRNVCEHSQAQERQICIFCEKWESGGIESLINNLITNMERSDLQIHIVAAELASSVFTTPLQEIGVRFFELSGSQKKVSRNRKLFREHLKRFHYDVIYLNVFHALTMQYLQIAKECHIEKRIVHSHNTALRKSVTRTLKLGIHHMAKHLYFGYATEYLACSKAAAEFMFPANAEYRFIPNGIDIERFSFASERRSSVRKTLDIPEECLLVGCIGRLCYQKNQRFLLDMMGELSKRGTNARLLLIGEGAERQKLERRAAELGIAQYVIFYGTTGEPEKLYSAMDVLAFPSRFEGLGIVAVEAQANGLPVLCSEYIPPEARISELAITVPLENGAGRWADAVCECAGHRELTAQQATCIGQFDIHKVSRQMRTIFCDRLHSVQRSCDE